MATAAVAGLPPGFELEPPPAARPSAAALPPGFELEPHPDAPAADSPLKQTLMAPVGAAEEFLKAGTSALASVPAGLAYGGAAVGKALGADVNPAELQSSVHDYWTHQPISNSGKAADQALSDTYAPVGKVVADKADEAAKAVGKVSPTAETYLREAPAAAQAALGVLPVAGAVGEGVSAARAAAAAPPKVARASADVAKEAGYTGVRTRADLNSPGNKKVTDALISRDAGIAEGTAPSASALTAARNKGPARIYNQAQNSLPGTLTQDPKLRGALASLQDGTSQMPKSPDVADLQKALLDQPQMTNEQLFNNVREARERASAYLASDDPDKNALGDAYHGVANAYEEFIGRQLKANPESPVTLEQFQQARTQFAKNYLAQAALKGDHFDPLVYGRTAQRNPNLLTGHAAMVGQVANSAEAAGGGVGASVAPVAAGAIGGEAAGHFAGVPGVGAAVGAIAAPMIRDAVHNFMTRGNLGRAAGAAENPALSYFFGDGEMPAGWNRTEPTPPPQKPMLALPAPSMVNAGGGMSTPNILDELGLSSDVQAAGAAHPGAPRAAAAASGSPLADELAPVRGPMETLEPPQVDRRGPSSEMYPTAGLSLTPERAAAASARRSGGDIPLADMLSTGVEKSPPQGLSLAESFAPQDQGIAFRGSPEAVGARPVQGGGAGVEGDRLHTFLEDMLGKPKTNAPELSLADEDTWFKGRENNSDVAGVRSQGVPDGTVARAPKRRIVGDTVNFPGGTPRRQIIEDNASRGGPGSNEAISRLEQEKAAGTQLVIVDPDGVEQALLPDVTRVDRNPPKGHIIADAKTGKIINSGGMKPNAAKALLNRWNTLRKPLGHDFGPEPAGG